MCAAPPPTLTLPRKGGGKKLANSSHTAPSPLTGEGWGGGDARNVRQETR
jgi:hypothetical protein